MAILAPVFVAVVVILSLWLVLKNWRFYYLLRKIPSPKCYLFFGNAYNLLAKPNDMTAELFRIMEEMRSSSIMCGWLFFSPLVVILKHSSAETVLSNSQEIDKSNIYSLLHPWLGLGLLTSTGNRWRIHRKLLTPCFHFRILENFLPIFNEQSQTLVSLLSKKAGSGRFDLYPYITRCALDVICETAMGKRIDCQLNKNSDYFEALTLMGEMTFTRILKPWLMIPWIFALSSFGKSQKKCLKILHGFTESVIAERRKEYEENEEWKNSAKEDDNDNIYGMKKRKAFLDTMIEASYNGEMGLTDQIIREQTDTFMFEGHDTTAVSMSWVLHSLGWCPTVQELVHQELDRVFGNSDRPVNLEDLNELKYLEAVIKETLRIIPSVPFYGRRLTRDVEIGGYTIPRGAEVLICPTSIGTDPDVYKNPKNFDPTRFFNEDFQTRHPYAYVPFSAGPRNCIGQKFAMMEEKVILANILRNFEIKSFNNFVDLEAAPDLVYRPINGLPISLERREVTKCQSGPLVI